MLVNAYIDGFNLYHALDSLNDDRVKWLDLMKLVTSLLREGETVGRVYYFTAVVTWDQGKRQRHTAYLKALRAVGVDVVESNFKKQPRYCFQNDRVCKFREEKKTDVAIAVSMLTDAFRKTCARSMLITSDSDQVPTVNAVRRANPDMVITLLLPPGESSGKARELSDLFNAKNRKELKKGLLERCLLPKDVYNKGGKREAIRPSKYDCR